VQQDPFSLITYRSPVAVSGSTFINTFGAGTHKICDGERYMKDLLEPEGCKNVG
jgi:hypothetical protein